MNVGSFMNVVNKLAVTVGVQTAFREDCVSKKVNEVSINSANTNQKDRKDAR